jgi:hypothetical protein
VYLVEEGPWPENDAGWSTRLRELQNRLYDAVDAVVDGDLAGRFPDLQGNAVRIQVDSPSGCPTQLQAFVDRFGEALDDPGEYRDAIAKSAFVSGLRVVTGHQMGRFQPKP